MCEGTHGALVVCSSVFHRETCMPPNKSPGTESEYLARMSPEEFKAEYKRKGWTGRALAVRWNYSVAWISKVGKDPEREMLWDDAVRGLPSVEN